MAAEFLAKLCHNAQCNHLYRVHGVAKRDFSARSIFSTCKPGFCRRAAQEVRITSGNCGGVTAENKVVR